jgi:hypothetical protein
MSPHFVTPHRKGNKNDPNHAEAICEAVTRPSMHFVLIKNMGELLGEMVERLRMPPVLRPQTGQVLTTRMQPTSQFAHKSCKQNNPLLGLLTVYDG